MESLRIAIAGSMDPTRTYEEPVNDCSCGQGAASAIGKELAKAGYSIIVYAGSPNYIESYVVEGYVAGWEEGGRQNGLRIEVRCSEDLKQKKQCEFPELKKHPALFKFVNDPHPKHWEITYYQSLKGVDGVVLIGGGRSTLITGVIAQVNRVPLVALASFGGAAKSVSRFLRPEKDLVTEEHIDVMNEPWSDVTAAKLVRTLDEQREKLRQEEQARREAVQQKDLTRGRTIAGICLVTGAALMAFGLIPTTSPGLFALYFFGAPSFAGIAGGVLRIIRDLKPDTPYKPIHSAYDAALLGLAAGLSSALLYFITQPVIKGAALDFSKAPQELRLLVVFLFVIGLAGGFATEAALGKLEKWEPQAPAAPKKQ